MELPPLLNAGVIDPQLLARINVCVYNSAQRSALTHVNRLLRELIKWKKSYVALKSKLTRHCNVLQKCLDFKRSVANGRAKQGQNYDTLCVACNVNQCEWGHVHETCVHITLCRECAPLCADKCPVCSQPGTIKRVYFSGVSTLANNVEL